MYHYVREVKKSIYPNLKALELKNFINQINFFKKKFNVLDYPNFIEILNSKLEFKIHYSNSKFVFEFKSKFNSKIQKLNLKLNL